MARYKIAAFWRRRNESRSECGLRMQLCLRAMREFSHIFASMTSLAGSKAAALMSPSINPDDIDAIIHKFKPVWEKEGQEHDEYGFSFGLWNGLVESEKSAGIHCHCGCCKHIGATFYPNNIAIDLPSCIGVSGEYNKIETFLLSLIKIWDADYGRLYDCEVFRALDKEYDKTHLPILSIAVFLNSRLFTIDYANLDRSMLEAKETNCDGVLLVNKKYDADAAPAENFVDLRGIVKVIYSDLNGCA